MKIGVTGNIGSGKSTVCKLFAVLGIPVYHADERAKWLLENDPNIIAQVEDLLGKEAYSNGRLNRKLIAEKVFADADLLKRYNAVIHPAVEEDAMRWEEAHVSAPYTIREAALLVESGSYKALDMLITVTAPEALRIARVMQRDGVGREAVEARVRNQMAEEKKVALSQAVIINDGEQQLIPQVWKIHHSLMERSAVK